MRWFRPVLIRLRVVLLFASFVGFFVIGLFGAGVVLILGLRLSGAFMLFVRLHKESKVGCWHGCAATNRPSGVDIVIVSNWNIYLTSMSTLANSSGSSPWLSDGFSELAYKAEPGEKMGVGVWLKVWVLDGFESLLVSYGWGLSSNPLLVLKSSFKCVLINHLICSFFGDYKLNQPWFLYR